MRLHPYIQEQLAPFLMMTIGEKIGIAPNGARILILEPHERLDVTTVIFFSHRIKTAFLKKQNHIIVNLGNLSFIDSRGLTALVTIMREAEEVNGSFLVCNIAHNIKYVFEITMMDSILDIFETEEEALKSPMLLTNLASKISKKIIEAKSQA